GPWWRGAEDDDKGLSVEGPCQLPLGPRRLLLPALASLWMLESTSSYDGGKSGGAEGSSITGDDEDAAGACGCGASVLRLVSPPDDGPCLSTERIVSGKGRYAVYVGGMGDV
ncbi:hypothetical protein GGI10_004229, partial [Coemansia sp. RSA 2530]